MFKEQLCISISPTSKTGYVFAKSFRIIYVCILHINRNPQPLLLNYNINKICIRKNFADIFVFSKNVLKRRKLLKYYFNIRLNFIYLLYSFDGLSI